MVNRISIIIPAYNAEKLILRCVESIVSQTYKDLEIIIVDDGSKDGTLQLCKSLEQKDNRIHVYTKPNGGPSSARKFGVEKSSSKYLFFADSDDTLPDDAIFYLVSKMNEHDLDIIQGGRKFIPYNGHTERISTVDKDQIIDSHTYIKQLFLGNANAGPHATIYKRHLFSKETFNLPDDVRVGEDFYMNLCLGIKAKRIGLFKEVVYNYIENNSSATHNYQFVSITPQKHLFESIRRELVNSKMFDEFAGLFYSRAIGRLCSACFHNRHLIYDDYCLSIAKEAEAVPLSKRDRALCFMLKHPFSYLFFYLANCVRQLFSK